MHTPRDARRGAHLCHVEDSLASRVPKGARSNTLMNARSAHQASRRSSQRGCARRSAPFNQWNLEGIIWTGCPPKIDGRGAPIQTGYPEWQSAWAVVELFWAARSMTSAYCGISLWPAAISLRSPAISLEVTCNKPWFRSRGQNGLWWGVRTWALGGRPMTLPAANEP